MTDPAECPAHPTSCCNCPPTYGAARAAAAELLERIAIGDMGARRDETVSRLIRHAAGERYADAPAIALEALLACAEQDRPRVAQAITMLRIELPV